MKVEINKEIFFEKLNKHENDKCIENESFLKVLEEKTELNDTKTTSIFIEKKRTNSRKDIFDTLIDI